MGTIGTKKDHLGTLLLKAGKLTEEQLDVAENEANQKNRWLSDVLIEKGFVDKETIQNFLSIHLGYPLVKLENTFIDQNIAVSIPEKFARRHGILPLYKADTQEKPMIVVAMADPANIVVRDELKTALGEEIFPAFSGQEEIQVFLDKIWNKDSEDDEGEEETARSVIPDCDETKPSVTKILEMIFKGCLETGAAAVHFESKKRFVSVRFKIDGDFRPVMSIPKDAFSAVVSRIKILAKIEVADSGNRLQEGWFHIRQHLSHPPIEVRVTVIPEVFGDKVVLKITRRSEIIRSFDDMGFEDEQLETMKEVISAKHGLVLISGKNDSGKSTCAYSMLSELESSSKMVVTIEDPFSYPVSSFNQIAKTDLAGHDKLSWDEALRAVERQDPHIVFLASADTTDEMQIMLRLAETGRFVLTSLHANDATSAYWVCFQREVYSYALASVLAGVVHCRLAKKLCNSCKTEVQPDQTALVKVGITSSDIKGKTFYYAPGCADCDNLGTSGRVGVYEVLELHDHLKGMIETKEASSSFRQAAIDSGMMTLKAAALRKAAAGIISLEEVIDLVS